MSVEVVSSYADRSLLQIRNVVQAAHALASQEGAVTSYSHLEIVIDSGKEFETDAQGGSSEICDLIYSHLVFGLCIDALYYLCSRFGRFMRWQWERDHREMGINSQDLLIWDLVFSITLVT